MTFKAKAKDFTTNVSAGLNEKKHKKYYNT